MGTGYMQQQGPQGLSPFSGNPFGGNRMNAPLQGGSPQPGPQQPGMLQNAIQQAMGARIAPGGSMAQFPPMGGQSGGLLPGGLQQRPPMMGPPQMGAPHPGMPQALPVMPMGGNGGLGMAQRLNAPGTINDSYLHNPRGGRVA